MAHLEAADTFSKEVFAFLEGSVGRLDMAHRSPLDVKQQQNKKATYLNFVFIFAPSKLKRPAVKWLECLVAVLRAISSSTTGVRFLWHETLGHPSNET